MKVPKFKTLEEAADFWESHDFEDYVEDTEPVAMTVRIRRQKKVLTVPIELKVYERLEALAARRSKPGRHHRTHRFGQRQSLQLLSAREGRDGREHGAALPRAGPPGGPDARAAVGTPSRSLRGRPQGTCPKSPPLANVHPISSFFQGRAVHCVPISPRNWSQQRPGLGTAYPGGLNETGSKGRPYVVRGTGGTRHVGAGLAPALSRDPARCAPTCRPGGLPSHCRFDFAFGRWYDASQEQR